MNLPQLTVTRFVAALGIVVYHLGRTTWPFSLAPDLVGLLHLAVSYFFTLSGFILVIAQVREGDLPAQVVPRPFYRNRLARVFRCMPSRLCCGWLSTSSAAIPLIR